MWKDPWPQKSFTKTGLIYYPPERLFDRQSLLSGFNPSGTPDVEGKTVSVDTRLRVYLYF
jgi:hypothetical protein